MMADPVTMEALLERIGRSRAALEALIAPLSAEQLEARVEGGWAITDHLAHIATWEAGVAAFLRRQRRAAAMGLSEDAWNLSLDEVNELIYEQNVTLSAAEARQKFKEAHAAMLDALAGLSDEDLARPHMHFLPHGEEGVAAQRPVRATIIANTYEHFDEHAEIIRRQLSER